MTKTELKAAARALGLHTFDKDTMKFFGAILETGVYKNGCFVESCLDFFGEDRRYTVKRFTGKGMETVGEFREYETKAEAVKAAREA